MKHLRTLIPTLLICLLTPTALVLAQDNPQKTPATQSDAKTGLRETENANRFLGRNSRRLIRADNNSRNVRWQRNPARCLHGQD